MVFYVLPDKWVLITTANLSYSLYVVCFAYKSKKRYDFLTIGVFLFQMSSMVTTEECYICETELKNTDDVLRTDCNHLFHRDCAQKRLETRQKSNCPVCHRDAAITNSLNQKTTDSSKNVSCFNCAQSTNTNKSILAFEEEACGKVFFVIVNYYFSRWMPTTIL